MASGITSPLGIFALVLLIIGVIMAIIGIIFIIARQNQTKDWWIWTLLIGGLVLAIFGGILLAVAMASYEPAVAVVTPVGAACAVPLLTPSHHHGHHEYPAPVVYPAPAPVCGVPRAVVTAPAYDYGHHHHNNGYYAAPVVTAAAPVAYYPRMAAVAPLPVNSTSIHPVGPDSFDPDPQMVTRQFQPAPQRVTATGPYGPNGETRTVAGTFHPATREVDQVYDYPNHPVQVTGAGYGYQPGYQARVGYAT